MKRARVVPFTTHMHDSDPGWDSVGNVMYEDDNGKLSFDNNEEELMKSATEQTPIREDAVPLIVKHIKLPDGEYAAVPWEQWKLFVEALHGIGVCLPPTGGEE